MYQDLIAEQQRIAQQQEESAQSGVDSLLARLEGSIAESGTVTKRTTEEEARLGVPDIQKNLREINQQIIDINAADFAQTQRQEDRLAPMSAITGAQAQIQRQNAVRTYGLYATANLLSGNLAAAQDAVSKSIAAEFEGVKAKIDFQTLQLQNNYDKLSTAQKKRADATLLQLDEAKRQVEQKEEERVSVSEVLITAGQNIAGFSPTSKYPSLNVALQAIQNASSYEEAARIASETGLLATPEETIEPKPFQFVSG